MAAPVPWTCPFCQKPVLIDSGHSRRTGFVRTVDKYESALDAAEGQMALYVVFTTCPDRECRKTALRVHLYSVGFIKDGSAPDGKWVTDGSPKRIWNLIPSSTAKLFPDFIPAPIREDYEEACAIRDLSPKASATLARRCLQGMIRDFFGVSVKSGKLAHEIDALKDKVDSEVWEAITAVRKVGNIGAQMEADINAVVDVEPDEAAKLIALIEMLLREWYIARQTRLDALAAVKAVAEVKAAVKGGASGPTGTP